MGGGAGSDLVVSRDRPPVAALARDGDPEGALGVAVTTEGIAPARGADVAVALAALVELRMGPDAEVTPAWDGLTLHLLAREPAAAVERARRALLTKVTAAELPLVQKRLEALARRPLPDPALAPLARCRGEPFGAPHGASPPPTLAELEGWRSAAFVRARVALAAVGPAPSVRAVVDAIARGPAWPAGEPAPATSDGAWPATPVVYDGAPELGTGQAAVTLAFLVERPRRAVAAAEGLAEAHGPLVSRLAALDGGPRLTDVTATAHPHGGCLTVKLTWGGLGSDAASRIATAVALTRQEVQVELTDAASREPQGLTLARRAGDPRVAAERAAFWTLIAPDPPLRESTPRVATAIALGHGRDAPTKSGAPPTDPGARLASEIDRALNASREPVIESRVKVEQGQAELWLALASPCGTLGEADLDAGLGGAFALVAAASADGHDDVSVEPIVAQDAIGVLAHARPAPGEPPLALAHRVADVAARAFAADPIDATVAGHVRADLLARGQGASQRGLLVAAAASTPGHTSWWSPLGNGEAFGRATEASLLARASAIRSGPLRVAVLANADAAQGAEATRAADRWVARRPGEARVCPAVATPPPPRPGTYAVESLGFGSEAWIAVPLPKDDEAARASALLTAAMLDGPGGLLASSLKSAGLARDFGARVLGPSRGAALVIHLASAEGALDAAVAQTRALLDRLRQGAMTEADRQRAIEARASEDLRSSLEPRQRALALLRGAPAKTTPPTLAALRAFAASNLRDEGLVLVAVRAPRSEKSP